MTETNEQTHNAEFSETRPVYPATVVALPDSYSVAINRGAQHGVKKGMTFIVYGLSKEEIVDPETKEKLGYLEIVRGTGTVSHVQDRIATIESNQKSKSRRTIKRRPRFLSSLAEEEVVEDEGTLVIFDDPQIGDKARPI